MIDLIDPSIMYVNDHAQKIHTGLPGSSNGQSIDEYNYLTYPGSNVELPGGRPELDHGLYE